MIASRIKRASSNYKRYFMQGLTKEKGRVKQMQIYDISQEVLGCKVYPGDPAPKGMAIARMTDGEAYNLSAFEMCAHNGTHIDAPFHFIPEGKTVDQMSLSKTVGLCYVAAFEGEITSKDAEWILQKAKAEREEACLRILLKGNATVTRESAEVFAQNGVELIGVESQTVGPENAPMEVHQILLSAEVCLLEGIRLGEVDEGVYFLHAAPLCLEGFDGAPCRATLVRF